MLNDNANPWLPKSPLQAFNVWFTDHDEGKAILHVSDGVVYRKQSILSLTEIESENTEDKDTTYKLRLDYAAKCYIVKESNLKVTASMFPMLIGVLDGVLVYTNTSLEKFTKMAKGTGDKQEEQVEEDDEDGLEEHDPESGKEDNEKETKEIPDKSRFIPVIYLTVDKDAFKNMVLKDVRFVHESSVTIGLGGVEGEEKEPFKEPIPEEAGAEGDPCENKKHQEGDAKEQDEKEGEEFGSEYTTSSESEEEAGSEDQSGGGGGDADPCDETTDSSVTGDSSKETYS